VRTNWRGKPPAALIPSRPASSFSFGDDTPLGTNGLADSHSPGVNPNSQRVSGFGFHSRSLIAPSRSRAALLAGLECGLDARHEAIIHREQFLDRIGTAATGCGSAARASPHFRRARLLALAPVAEQ
jgi:hypothetical protein